MRGTKLPLVLIACLSLGALAPSLPASAADAWTGTYEMQDPYDIRKMAEDSGDIWPYVTLSEDGSFEMNVDKKPDKVLKGSFRVEGDKATFDVKEEGGSAVAGVSLSSTFMDEFALLCFSESRDDCLTKKK